MVDQTLQVRPSGQKFMYFPHTSHGVMLLNLMCLEWISEPDETGQCTVGTVSGDQFTVGGNEGVSLWARLANPLS